VRCLGLDYGSTRIGVAVSDDLGLIARPLPCVQARDRQQAAEAIAQRCREHRIERVVLGLPLNANASEGPAAQAARALGDAVAAATGLTVVYFDERLTTQLAQRILNETEVPRRRHRQRVDSMAAVVILQNYLDANGPGGER